MRRNLSKLCALLVALSMVVAMFPTTVLAASPDGVTMYVDSTATYDTPPARAEGAVYKTLADAAAKVETYKDTIYIRDKNWDITEDFTLEKPAATFKLRIAEDSSLTIDLKGNELNLNTIPLVNDGQLSVTDSTGGGVFSSNANPTIDNYGTLSIHADIASTKSMAVKCEAGSELKMEAGTLTGTAYSIYVAGGNSTVTVKEGQFHGELDGAKTAQMTIGVAGAADDTVVIDDELSINADSIVNCGDVQTLSGKFSADTTINCKIRTDISSKLAAGQQLKEYSDAKGTYYKIEKLSEENAAAWIEKADETIQYYSSAVSAAAATGAGDKLVVNADTEDTLKLKSYGVTIDLGGNHVGGIDIIASGDVSPVTISNGTVDNLEATASDSTKYFYLDIAENVLVETLSLDSVYVSYSDDFVNKLTGPGFSATDGQGEKYLCSSPSVALELAADQTAYLVKDYTGNQTLSVNADGTIDLMGFTYTVDADSNTRDYTLYPTGSNQNLTVRNGGLVNTNQTSEQACAVSILSGNITLTLDDVDIESAGVFGIVANGSYENIHITLKNSSVATPNGMGIYFPNKNSSLTIDNSEITAHTGIGIKGGKITIKGDTKIQANGEKYVPDEATSSGIALTGDAIYIEGNYGFETVVDIKDGTFTSEHGEAVQKLFDESEPSQEKYDVNIAGGSFSTKPKDEYLVAGNTLQENEDGSWGIQANEDAVVMIGSTGYVSLEEALANAEDGDTIVLLTDMDFEKAVSVDKSVTIEGQAQADGSKIVITGANGMFSYAAQGVAGKMLTLKNLELQATQDGQWYLYHSRGTLAVENCDFTMGTSVTYTGNIIMGEGKNSEDSSYQLQFKNNTVKANSRAALVGVGNGSVITNNTIDLISERHNNTDTRTSIIALTADENGTVVITDNTFRNANRAVAVDNSTIKGENLTYQNNKFYDVRYAFEISPTKNADEEYDISHNYFEFDGKVDAAKIQNADAEGDNFSYGDSSTEYQPSSGDSLVSNEPYYEEETMRPQDLNTYVPPSSGSSSGGWDTTRYSITASAGEGGTISPSGDVRVSSGADKTFTISAYEGYVLNDVTVDGESVGKVTTYTFEDVKAAHTIHATFTKINSGVEPDILPFTDVSASDWFYNAVVYNYENNIMKGMSATAFAPNSNLTRAMLAQVLYNLEGQPSAGAGSFADVASGQWYTDAINWAANNQIVNGYGNNRFGPNDNITREQLATILYRYASYKGYEIITGGNSIHEFSDSNKISSWAMDAMRWAVSEGVINGNANGTLDPTGNATRAQVAQMMMNFLEKYSA